MALNSIVANIVQRKRKAILMWFLMNKFHYQSSFNYISLIYAAIRLYTIVLVDHRVHLIAEGYWCVMPCYRHGSCNSSWKNLSSRYHLGLKFCGINLFAGFIKYVCEITLCLPFWGAIISGCRSELLLREL